MKPVDLKTKLRTARKENMQEDVILEDGTKVKKDVELLNMLFFALRTGFDNQKDGEPQKLKDYTIQVKLIMADGGEVDLDIDERARLKAVVTRTLDSFVAGQIGTILEGEEIPF